MPPLRPPALPSRSAADGWIRVAEGLALVAGRAAASRSSAAGTSASLLSAHVAGLAGSVTAAAREMAGGPAGGTAGVAAPPRRAAPVPPPPPRRPAVASDGPSRATPACPAPAAAPVHAAAPAVALAPAAPPVPAVPAPPPAVLRTAAVPSTRLSRATGFASLGANLLYGAAAEAVSRAVAPSSASGSGPLLATDRNADALSSGLRRMRGAALKLGQMLSVQDESMLPPALARALGSVRGGADVMPRSQLEAQMAAALGTDWRDSFARFDDVPCAAASLGQVHLATLHDGRRAAVKVQYPGVADSIESDLRNLHMLIKLTNFAPPGLFIDEVVRVGRQELVAEVDYQREAESQRTFRRLVAEDPVLRAGGMSVPDVIDGLSRETVLVTEYAPGATVDRAAADLPQEERNRIGREVLRLTITELFRWRFMQTDPNWANFLYDADTATTHLIDFGACRTFDKKFVDGYLRIVWAAAQNDSASLMAASHDMGFLTGDEGDVMLEAHRMSGLTVGEPFQSNEPYDFAASGISKRISGHGAAFMQHRLTPPPSEVYSLHRKLSGAYALCIKLGAVVQCRDLLEEVVEDYVFEDGVTVLERGR